MTRLKSTLTGGILTLVVCLMVIAMMLAMTSLQAVQADTIGQPAQVSSVNDTTFYLPLTDTPPQRDITGQRLAPVDLMP